ncbi:MAG: response regulator transcription factor, partial [Actinomycetota bacterium]
MKATFRILLVDDQELIRDGLRRILSSEDTLEVTAEAADGAEALDALSAATFDIVVMDIRMRGMDGIEATARIHRQSGPPVLVLTTFDDDEILWGAIDAGAAGFILKEAPAVDLIRATHAVAAGGSWLDPIVTPRVLEHHRTKVLPAKRRADRAGALTDRENEVLRAMARGLTNAEIAAELIVGAATVK